MLARSKQIDRVDQVDCQVRAASAVTADLVSEVIGAACDRLPIFERTENAARIRRLVEGEAWTDVSFALVELELPQWKIRRLALEDGKWLCSLSKQAYLPVEVDDAVDVTHEILPLAVLNALLEVRRHAIAAHETLTKVPKVRPAPRQHVSCSSCLSVMPVDNFS